MKLLLVSLVLSLLPSLGSAAVLALEVRDPGAVKARCEDALEQLIADQTTKENGEGLACLATDAISANDRETIKNGFLVRCETKANARLERAYGSAIKIEIEELREEFSDEYGPLLQKNCADAEHKRIAVLNATRSQSSAISTQGNGRGMMESWYKKNGF